MPSALGKTRGNPCGLSFARILIAVYVPRMMPEVMRLTKGGVLSRLILELGQSFVARTLESR